MSYNSLLGLGDNPEDSSLKLWVPGIGATANDQSTNGNVATWSGTEDYDTAKFGGGNALSLDGSSDIDYGSSVADYPNVVSDFTAMVWVYDTSININEYFLGNSGGFWNGWAIAFTNANRIRAFIGDGDLIGGSVSTSTWANACLTYDESSSILEGFVDNASIGTATVATKSTSTGSMRIGSRNGSLNATLNLFDVVVFSRILSSDERAEIINGPELFYDSGASFGSDGAYDIGTWTLGTGGSNGPQAQSIIAVKADGTEIDTASTATGTLDLSSAAGETVYLMVRVQNSGGYDIGDSGTRTPTWGSAGDGYYELASVIAAGASGISGSLSSTLSDATVTSAGELAIAASLGKSLDAATVTSAGELAVSAITNATLDDATVAASGVVGNPPISASLSVTLDNATVTSAGVLPIEAAASITLDDATASGIGTSTIAGSLATTLDDCTLAATTVGDNRTASADITLDNLTITAIGTASQPTTVPPIESPLLQTAERWLRSKRRSNLAKTVSYRRGGAENPEVQATQAETRVETDNGDLIITSRVVDWLIDRADLTLADLAVEPRPGDQIAVAADHATLIYEACAVGDEPAYRWHGRDAQTFRIHTKQIGTE